LSTPKQYTQLLGLENQQKNDGRDDGRDMGGIKGEMKL
jgi:hypothetical protein